MTRSPIVAREMAIERAGTSAQVLGTLCILFGLGVGCCVMPSLTSRRTKEVTGLAIGSTILISVVPGFFLFFCQRALRRRKEWAAITLLVVGALTTIGSGGLLLLGLSDLAILVGGCLPLLLATAIFLMSVLTIINTARAMKAIAAATPFTNATVGFAPIMPGADVGRRNRGIYRRGAVLC